MTGSKPFKCKKCNGTDFEVVDSTVQEINSQIVLIESQTCEKCGTLHKAKYQFVSWEEWKET